MRLKNWFRAAAALSLVALGVPAHALSGTDVSHLVNQRYQSTPSRCFVDKPAYACSGVLLRAVAAGAGDFWRLGSDETTTGIARLSYARRDMPQPDLPSPVGFVLADVPSAAGDGRPYELRCGCPPLASTLPACADCPSDPNEVGVNTWNVNAPVTIPIQAIFYDVGHGGQLTQALQYQKQYYDATRQWVPILRTLLADKGASAFGFDERDQLDWGYKVVKDLDARFVDLRMTCPGNTPGYACSGILIRDSGYGTAFHSWNPSPNSQARNGVSFSYARSDMNMRTTAGLGPGVIMRELQAPTAHPLQWRCAFPTNACTACGGYRSDSCNTGSDYRLCDARGIDTAEQWLTSYRYAPGDACGLAPTVAQFETFAALRQTFTASHDEIIIAPWPQDIPMQIPLQALYYPSAGAKPGAQYIQNDYMNTTGHFMPILYVDLTQPAGSVFTYDPDDQQGALSHSVLAIFGAGHRD
ncbi:hypothetical protein [Pandoraea pulmonicola]|uniref:Uncharacterized protein n=1 Tax=Pandoraea pulmonicola TaxID=93221 RepID=A0AAJ4ZA53_PANPU|nr:hypothetical protein [Pandoraea pulmonicola]AJC21561.1 hypothetical protein RO07_15620 [Pandoraea pulmonicola]SUA89635.1 Uncharacterised protein [Pandoraea pulmonicola]